MTTPSIRGPLDASQVPRLTDRSIVGWPADRCTSRSASMSSIPRMRKGPEPPRGRRDVTSRELLITLRGLVDLDIVGADIVEVAPMTMPRSPVLQQPMLVTNCCR